MLRPRRVQEHEGHIREFLHVATSRVILALGLGQDHVPEEQILRVVGVGHDG
jgi:hypothetical protein